MTLAAQNVKKHMVTTALNTKQFFSLSKQYIRNLTGSDSRERTILSPGRHIAMPRDISAYHSWGGPTGTEWVEARDAANHPLKHTTAPPPPNRKSPGPKCQ